MKLPRLSNSRFSKLSLVVLLYNIAVINWGAYVRASGSGAGCGRHWPLCNGEIVPRAPVLQTLVEYSHRLTSGVALLAVLLLVVGAFARRHEYPNSYRWSLGALFFVVVEAAIGAGLVLLELVGNDDSAFRAVMMAVHLTNSFGLLGTLVLSWRLGKDDAAASGEFGGQRGSGVSRGALATLVALLLVGASGAITALGDTLFPQVGHVVPGFTQNFFDSSTYHFLVQLRVVHPMLAAAMAIWLVCRVVMLGNPTESKLLSRGIIGLLVLQCVVGPLNILLGVPISLQLVHLLLADVLWVLVVLYEWEWSKRAAISGS